MTFMRFVLIVLVAGLLGGGAGDLTRFLNEVGRSASEARAELGSPSESASCQSSQDPVVVVLSERRLPDIAGHVRAARKAGFPRTLTLRRDLATGNWNQLTAGMKNQSSIDLWPIAASAEAEKNASVARVSPAQNNRAGNQIARQLSSYCDGQSFRVHFR